ncbi:MAG: UvrD-helicase domain-containing protein [Saprospiraceae bacterium]|nr:UvrD-helicase domain-containing protein [Saprospiraceae bacterium]MDP4997414.1 UvrD-helicase domain-containing protein [Saprospiraceae bacterium]
MNFLNELNDIQREAVVANDGPVLVVAGPGSGKTRVLTYRIAWLLAEDKAKADEILALTFTNKAAREMKERIQRVAGESAGRLWAGTFHSIFARILRTEAAHIGYPTNFTVYDTDDTKSLLSTIIKEMNLPREQYNVNGVRARISWAKSKLITPKLYVEDEELRREDKQKQQLYIYEIYARYTARCKMAGAMDFDDLLYRTYELLQTKHPETKEYFIAEKYRNRFKYILVDEFQDTNTLQYAIIRKLVNPENHNIYVVGDDAQSIYGFRGATIQNILDFEQDYKPFGIKTVKLVQNYRSTAPIVQAANRVIAFNRQQIQKQIRSEKGEGQKIRIVRAMTDDEEARRVVDAILEQKNRDHLQNKDIAILYRTNAQSRSFEENLLRYDIKYKIFGGVSFYQRKEVKDLIAYLRVAVNPKDDEALKRVINYPKRGFGKTSMDKIEALAAAQQLPFWDALGLAQLGGRMEQTVLDFKSIFKEAHENMANADAAVLARSIVLESGLLRELKEDTTPEGKSRLENVNALLDGIQAFVEDDTLIDIETLPDKTLATYLQNVALMTDMDSDESDQDYVTLMSVHAAKGLEFKSVFVVGMEEDLFPSFMSKESLDAVDEERRLFYVAITRAEQLLTLTYANSRYRFGKMQYNSPSRFLEELPLDQVENAGQVFGGEPSAKKTPTGASVSGNFSRRTAITNTVPRIDPATFQPSPSDAIQAGMEVLHLKFGKGKVLHIDGGAQNRVATIVFEASGAEEKRIMLKFAKLQIL